MDYYFDPDLDDWIDQIPQVGSRPPRRAPYLISEDERLGIEAQVPGQILTDTMLTTATRSRPFAKAREADWEAIDIAVSYDGRITILGIDGWAAPLADTVGLVEVVIGDRTVSFARSAGWCVELEDFVPSGQARIDDIALPVRWLWKPKVECWHSKTGGTVEAVTAVPVPHSSVLVTLTGTLPPGARFERGRDTYELREEGPHYALSHESGDDVLWSELIDAVTGPKQICAVAEQHTPNPLDVSLIKSLERPARYFLKLRQAGRAGFAPQPSSDNPRPGLFGPPSARTPAPLPAPGIQAFDSEGTRRLNGAPTSLPRSSAEIDSPLILRASEDSYGVLRAAGPFERAEGWAPAHVIAGSGLISWCGLIDRFRTVEFVVDGDRTFAVLFENGFLLDEGFVWAAPFGGVGMVKGQSRWCNARRPVSELEHKNDRWIARAFVRIDIEHGVGTTHSDTRYEPSPFLIALRPPGGGESGAILSVEDGMTAPRFKGILATCRATLHTVKGSEIPVGPAEGVDYRYVVGGDADLERLPPRMQRVARIAIADSNLPEDLAEGIHWEKLGPQLILRYVPSSEVFVA